MWRCPVASKVSGMNGTISFFWDTERLDTKLSERVCLRMYRASKSNGLWYFMVIFQFQRTILGYITESSGTASYRHPVDRIC